MTTWIAERRLLVSKKGSSEQKQLLIRVGKPYLLEKGMVNFEFDEGTSGCSAELVGIDEGEKYESYGADSLQALQIAADVEHRLRALSKKYDLYFPGGEPYFEDE